MNAVKAIGKMFMILMRKKNHNGVASALWLCLKNRWVYWQGLENNLKKTGVNNEYVLEVTQLIFPIEFSALFYYLLNKHFN